MDQRERADKIEPTLAAEPIENAEASDRSSLARLTGTARPAVSIAGSRASR
jgi:hypothetical protein